MVISSQQSMIIHWNDKN